MSVHLDEVTLSSYSRMEVANHNTLEDSWMIYKNKVYDVTKFIPLHPAGPQSIIDYSGSDATEAFDAVGHS